jgi:phosphonate transport system substrate-binding protein
MPMLPRLVAHPFTRLKSVLLASLLAAGCALAGLTPAGALDSRFKDADGDLVADAPTNPAEWVDPPVLVFAYTPVEDPAVYARVWDGFLKHMEQVTGKRVQFFPVQSNAAQIEAMRAGRLHVAGFNTGSNPLAVSCAGFVPITIMGDKTGDYGYRMQIITFPGSGIDKVEDIRGKKMAFTAETSNSGYKAPSAMLRDTFKLEAGKDFEAVFSGRHDNSILGVANKDYPAAAIASEVLRRMIVRDVVKQEQIRIVYESDRFPTTGYGHVYNLKPELAAKVRDAFFTFKWEGTELLKEFGKSIPAQEAFLPITYKEKWAIVRAVDQSMGVKYECK